MWTKKQIDQHIEATRRLAVIRENVFSLLRSEKEISEYEVMQYIYTDYKKQGLVTAYCDPIVSFGRNTASYHHQPAWNSRRLKNRDLIMVDIFAKLKESKAPFGDITWMAYNGNKVPKKVQKHFQAVIETRDLCLNYIKAALENEIVLTGGEIDNFCSEIIVKKGYGRYIEHCVGHAIGTASPHGNRALLISSNQNPIHTNLGYTIEPGVYVPGKRGVRSEIDFYVSSDLELIVTSDVQKELVLV